MPDDPAVHQIHLGDILSITTGKLVSPRGVEGVYDILNFMTGEDIYTHQIGRAMKACAPSLKGQHPQLADVSGEEVGRDNWKPWLAEQVARFGETLPVEPLKPGAYEAMDPVDEAVAMVGKDNVIVLNRAE